MESMLADLQHILEFVDRVQTVCTDGIDPLVHPVTVGTERYLDEPESIGLENLNQTTTAETVEDFYVVPKVIER